MDFWRFLQILQQRRGAIAVTVLATTLLTPAGVALLGRQYEALATLMPSEGATAPAAELAREQSTPPLSEERRRQRLGTLIAILESPAVLGQVIADLKLDTAPGELAKAVQVEVPTAEILQVRVHDSDPQRAVAIVNALVERFVDFHARLRTGEVETHLKFLDEQLAAARRELDERREAVRRFKNEERIASLPEQMSESLSRMSSLEAERANTHTRLAEVQARLNGVVAELRRTPPFREVPVLPDTLPEITRVRAEIADLESNLRQLLTRYTEKHRDVVLAREQLQAARTRLRELERSARQQTRSEPNPVYATLENNRVLLENERDGLQARLVRLSQELQRAHADFAGFSGMDVRMASLTQQYNLADQRYTTLLTRWQQLQMGSDDLRRGASIAIVDRAGPWNPAVDLSRPRMLKLVSLAFVLSLIGAVAVVVGLDTLDRRVRTTSDITALVQLPVVTVVPRAPLGWSMRDLAMCTARHPGTAVAEAYRFLGVHVLQHARGRGASVLMALTARPAQGATATLCNLAITLAQADQRVILVDADMRRPKLHRVFGVPNERGLSDLLTDSLHPTDALLPTSVENLRIMPAGACPENPWEVLRSRRMAGLVERLRQHADFVLFNAPSATIFADALSIASQMDGAILVVRAQQPPTGVEQQLKQWLDQAAIPVLGVVLNDMPAESLESFRYHRYYLDRDRDLEWDEPNEVPALGPHAALG